MNHREAEDNVNVTNNHFYYRKDKFRLVELTGLDKVCSYFYLHWRS